MDIELNMDFAKMTVLERLDLKLFSMSDGYLQTLHNYQFFIVVLSLVKPLSIIFLNSKIHRKIKNRKVNDEIQKTYNKKTSLLPYG